MTSEPNAEQNLGSAFSRFGHMALAVTIGVSVAGFLLGVREQTPEGPPAATPSEQPVDSPSVEDLPPVVAGYGEMNQYRRGPNANWHSSIPTFQEDPTAHFGDAASTPEQRQAALGKRGARRAFSGAPPVAPHSIDQRNAQACLVCHGAGVKIGMLVAPKMSHHMMTNCTQCHVEMQQGLLASVGQASNVESTFVGLQEPGVGDRIGPGAPPTIPHPIWMRSECSSCHGSLGGEGMRTSHPWRSNCTQCHAPSRNYDWKPLEQPPAAPPKRAEDPANDLAGIAPR